MSEGIVTLVEVGPRDGLQNEKQAISTGDKIALVERLALAGLPIVEAGAFVSPKWVPQMAASEDVFTGIKRRASTRYPALVPNLKGYEAARAADVREIAIFTAASESFSQKNTNASIAETLERFAPVVAAARADRVRVRGYVSCVMGCPYEGAVDPRAVVRVANALHDLGCYEISLGDTIGVGTAGQTARLIRHVADALPISAIAGHFHDTYGQALANIYAALDEGVRTFDTSISGLGGCPYAPGASGNVATEDVVYMLERSGYRTGIDEDALFEVSRWISSVLGRNTNSRVTAARLARNAKTANTD